jgi:hypothetical protein
MEGAVRAGLCASLPQQFLNLRPLRQGQLSLRDDTG